MLKTFRVKIEEVICNVWEIGVEAEDIDKAFSAASTAIRLSKLLPDSTVVIKPHRAVEVELIPNIPAANIKKGLYFYSDEDTSGTDKELIVAELYYLDNQDAKVFGKDHSIKTKELPAPMQALADKEGK